MQRTIRKRAILLGLGLGLLICLATPFNNLYLGATPLSGGHFPLAPFFLLLVLTLISAAYGALFKTKPMFTGYELLCSWMLMVAASGLAYTGLARTFFINLTAPLHFGTPANRWAEVLRPLLPNGWYPTDEAAVKALYEGLEGGRGLSWLEVLGRIPWQAWSAPLLSWGMFILLCFTLIFCLVNIFSRQWISNERMNFPLLRLPYLLEESMEAGSLGRFLSNPYLLTGLFFTLFLHGVNGLNFYYPAAPQIPTLILAGPYFPKTGLFSGFAKLKFYFYPAFIGFAFLTARQISLSFWAFYLLGGLLFGALTLFGMQLPASALGVTFGPTLASPEETQSIGAYGVFFFFILWLARYHLMEVAKIGLGRTPSEPGLTEWFSLRVSFWLFWLAMAGLLGWCAWFGLPLLPALLLVGAFFMVMLVASRIICQGGIAYFTLIAAPTDGLLALFGSGLFSKLGILMAAAMQKMLFVDLRESLMPSLFHASKVSEGGQRRGLFGLGLALSLLLGAAVSLVAMLVVGYKYGLRDLRLEWETGSVLGVYENVQRLLEAPSVSNPYVIYFALAGAVVMLLLVVAYQRFYWWPIHPLGYLTMYSSAMRILWYSFFLGWLFNHLTLRYGGISLFTKVRFIFIGLIMGDFLASAIFAIIGIFMGQSYQVLPG